MKLEINPIGFLFTEVKKIPRHWSVSDAEGVIHLEKEFVEAAGDIEVGQDIVVIFLFDRSRRFTKDDLLQFPKNKNIKKGVFSICSPVRPNPIGMSVLHVLSIQGTEIGVRGIDILNGTPIIDIKPYVKDKYDCPSRPEEREKK